MTPTAVETRPHISRRPAVPRWLSFLLVVGLIGVAWMAYDAWRTGRFSGRNGMAWMRLPPGGDIVIPEPTADPKPQAPGAPQPMTIAAPELEGGVEWLNTGGPIRMKDLKGKVVLLDFWTYCCINCIHILPDLEKLEKKYANQLVVIGVHSAKFSAEKDSKNIKDAILRYNIEHPVVNDANHKIWRAYEVSSWPTFWLIDPEGKLVGTASGEGLLDALDKAIGKLVELHRTKKTLNEQPLRFNLAKFAERKDSPLYFPGKVLADAASGRLFIADSSHHRIVIATLDGKVTAVAGSGEAGQEDGPFAKATFNDPQGMAVRGDTLYVADRKNHLIRMLDLKSGTVTTLAGTGTQGRDRYTAGPGRRTALNSPWDLWLLSDHLFIAMAGHHQIWRLDLKTNTVSPFAGDGREDIGDGTRADSQFAQPSGLSSDGTWLYVADSEVSAVRAVSLGAADQVKTLVGRGLFEFGDVDGEARTARLQHALGVALYQGKVMVADTYNNKLKLIDAGKVTTFLGDGQAGKTDEPPRFDEPAGISIAGDTAYIADTNNHAIRVVDLKAKKVRTLSLEGLKPPAPPATAAKPYFPNPTVTRLPVTAVPPNGEVTFAIKINLDTGYKLNEGAPVTYLVEAVAETPTPFTATADIEKPTSEVTVKVPAEKLGGAKAVKVSLLYYPCQIGGEGLCTVRSEVWEIPLKVDPQAAHVVALRTTVGDK